ncbi:Major facilitator superfamily transporter [uncultured Alphaproteobacteria bacterium]|uniref:Major facilitator superfamily transporter n=1 Tax=uncultured Alphaproteobacteria bacterium TaxID=91750 RepID=A0A212IZK5_9PROT|nr:Major facilitator superfamily transporter [uncultured Alphaproteobacteria bacterium]
MEINGAITQARSPHLGVAALAMAILLASLGISIVTVALPILARDFALPVTGAQWVVLAYLLSVTVTIVMAGRLGDLIGHRRVLLAGLVIFGAASAFCSIAPTIVMLIAARVTQGVGGAILMALPVSIIREAVVKERTGSAMGLLGTMSAIGTALGPSLGGVVIAWSGWRATFLILALMALVALIFAARALPTDRIGQRGERKSLDLPGALVLVLTLAAYSLSMSGGGNGFSITNALLLAGAALGVVVFVIMEHGRETPLVDPAALGSRTVSVSLLMNLLVSNVMMATLVVGPFYLTFALHLNEALVGLVVAVGPVMAALSGVPAGRITDRFGAGRTLIVGLGQMVIGLLCLSVLPDIFGVAGYILSLMLLTPGFQLFLAANNTTVMLAARDDQRGMISGLLGPSRNLGFMTGASVMGAVFAMAAGTPDIVGAAPEAISAAFATTFQMAAGLMAFAILLTVLKRGPSR